MINRIFTRKLAFLWLLTEYESKSFSTFTKIATSKMVSSGSHITVWFRFFFHCRYFSLCFSKVTYNVYERQHWDRVSTESTLSSRRIEKLCWLWDTATAFIDAGMRLFPLQKIIVDPSIDITNNCDFDNNFMLAGVFFLRFEYQYRFVSSMYANKKVNALFPMSLYSKKASL